MQLRSLQLLSEAHRNTLPTSRYCCRASDDWFRHLHANSKADVATDASWAAIAASFEAMMADADGYTSVDALQQILRHANVTPFANLAEFPGPMCSPLCKKDLPKLRDNAYTFTEKSDGIRVVVVSLWVPSFVSWTCDGETKALLDLSHLASVFALEKARQACHQGDSAEHESAAASAEVALFGKCYTLRTDAGEVPVTTPPELRTNDGEERFVLSERAVDGTAKSDSFSFSVVRRHRGRHCAYAIDRSLEAAYLFLDDHTSSEVHDFVVDGELMCVRATVEKAEEAEEEDATADNAPRLLLGAFDLFSFARPTGDSVPLTTASMMKRYEQLRAVLATVANPPEAPDTPSLIGHVTWYAKTMWRLTDIAACLARLHYSPAHQCFLFDGPYGATENDGLIFTPDVFPISVGSSSTQLKWKWRHLLSIDWLVQASATQPDLYTVSLFFMKKNYGHREDVVGHWRLRRPMRLENPHGFDMPVDTAVVAECAYDFHQKQWYIQRLRPDKRGANSVVTAISVYESLVEGISLPRLVDLLPLEAAPSAAAQRLAHALEDAASHRVERTNAAADAADLAAPPSTPFDVAEVEKCVTARVTLRAIRESRGNTELYLNTYTNQTNKAVKHPLPFPLRKIRDCTGLGYDAATATTVVPTLEEALYIQLGNAGGCCAWSDFVVDAFYNGGTGYWELVHLNPRGDNKDALFDNVIEHLHWLLKNGSSPEKVQAVLDRKRDKPLQVVATAVRSAATRQTNEHYASVAKELANADRSDLRRFNNWVKSVLITAVAAQVRKGVKSPAKLHAVDLCCGRGGDLLKWQHLRPAFVFMTDAAVECVAEAAARYSTSEGQSLKSGNGKKPGFPAFFAVHDAFDDASGLRRDLKKRGPFQLMSCQFSMHYGCRSSESIRYFVRVIADSLVPHGRFVGTTVSDTELLSRAKERGPTYGNTVYQVHFSEEAFAQLRGADFDPTRLPFGVPYATTVERSVRDMVEYVVPWTAFVRLCAEHYLQLVLEDNFAHYYEAHKDTEEGKAVLCEMQRKRGHDGDAGGITLSAEEQEAVGLYRLFVFERVDKKA